MYLALAPKKKSYISDIHLSYTAARLTEKAAIVL
jgi:hypothetical protein